MYGRNRKVYGAVLALFLFYSVGMLWLLFGRTKFTVYDSYWEQISMNINLRPFRTIMEYVRLLGQETGGYGLSVSEINLYGNVVVFLPCGLFLPFLWKRLRSFRRYLLCFCTGLIAIELAQLFTLRGICDIDDLILNVLGASIGFAIWKIIVVLQKLRTKETQSK